MVEDTFPIVNMPIAVRLEREPLSVFLAPDIHEISCEYRDGYVHTNVTELDGHAMLVIKYKIPVYHWVTACTVHPQDANNPQPRHPSRFEVEIRAYHSYTNN